MIWSFERSGRQMSCEIRRDEDGQYYEFVLKSADGSEKTERYEEPSEVIARSVDIMRSLIEEGWRSIPQKAPTAG